MRITSAPISANSMAQNGPGPMPAISITLTPSSGPISVSLTCGLSLFGATIGTRPLETNRNSLMSISSEKTDFRGHDGQMLAARLERASGVPRAYALFAHCFTCTKDIYAARRISQGLAERGIAVLRFDFTGLGASEGDFGNTGFTSNIDDLIAAASFLREEHEAPTILIGHSLGGAAVLRAAEAIPEAAAVATIGAPADPAHVAHLLEDKADEIRDKGRATVNIGGRPFDIRAEFLDDITANRPRDYIGDLRKALIVFHGPRDQIVGIENAAEIFTAAKHPKSFVSLDDADHLLSRQQDADYVADVLSAWASRYIGETEKRTTPQPPDGITRVAESGTGRFTQDVWAGGHFLQADEPASFGGDNVGPTPYDLLSAALGACTTMTIRMYADRKKLPLEQVSVDVSHEKIHASDCADCETESGKVDRFSREITLSGDLDETQRARLLEIADKCPVHRTLLSEVKVETREVT
nr:lipase/esterase [uncultured bacterium]